ncbi:MAG: hypothetical protein QMD05_07015 [Candidatus Brocadiaceae bacterium]|nr:hypothetical protein [Candidatus Brocadiaceae bacterium]
MEQDIVEEVTKAEAEAEELLKHSRAKAKGLEKEAEEAINQLRHALEEEFRVRAEELRQLRQKERQEAEARLNEGLASALGRLKGLGEERSEEVARRILHTIIGKSTQADLIDPNPGGNSP